MSSLVLKTDPASYKQTITRLEGNITQLKNVKLEYEKKLSEIRTIWTGNDAEPYYNLIATEIDKVNQAIDGLQSQVDQINQMLEKNDYTISDIVSTVSDVASVATKLFI